MRDMQKYCKIINIACLVLLLITVVDIFYVNFLPDIIYRKLPVLENYVSEKYGFQTKIVNPQIKTYPNFKIFMSCQKFTIYHKNDIVFNSLNSDVTIQPLAIIFKSLKINKFKSEELYVNFTYLKHNFSKDKNNKLKKLPIKIDADKALFDIKTYKFIYADKKLNKNLSINGNFFKLFPSSKKFSELTTDGYVSIDKNISSFNLKIIGKFIFNNKIDFQNFSITGYVKNIRLEKIAPYLNEFTQYKNAKGLINISFNSVIKENKNYITDIITTIEDLSINEGNYEKQILARGKNIINAKINVKDKKIYFEKLKFKSSCIDVTGEGVIDNYRKDNPDIKINFNINKSSVQNIVDILPFGICKEIDIVKKKGFFGNINGALKIQGKFPDLKFYGNMHMSNVHALRNIDISHNGYIDLIFKDTTVGVVVNMKTISGETFYLNGTGRIYDDDWSYFDIKTSEHLALKLVTEILTPISQIFEFDIGPVPLFTVTSGTGSSKMHIKGKKDIAFIDGFVKIKNGSGVFDGINTKLSNVNFQLDFNGENILFSTQSAFADNNSFQIYGEGSTTGHLKMNISSKMFNTYSLQKIIQSSSFLQDNACIFDTIKYIKGKTDFNILIQGDFEPNIPIEKFKEEIEKLKIKGNVILFDNVILLKDIDSPINILNGNIAFTEKDFNADKISIKYGKNSKAFVSIQGIIPQIVKNIDGTIKIYGDSLSISDSLNLLYHMDIVKEYKNIKIPVFSGLHSIELTPS